MRLLAFAALMMPIAGSAFAQAPPPDLYGTYGPRGDCGRSPRVSLDATGLYMVTGNTRGGIRPIDTCFTCAGGDRYEGIEIWVGQIVPNGHSMMFRFNADEKRGALTVERTGDAPLGPNQQSLVANSPYRRCGPPTLAAH